jgi:hypothetical protein
MADPLTPSYWSAERGRIFADQALAWFDETEVSFGDLIKIDDVLALAGIKPTANGRGMSAGDYRDRQIVELRLLSIFRDCILERRNRCLKQQGAALRILHPEEQLEYGEIAQSKAALQKLRKGARIVEHTDTNDNQKKQAAIERIAASEDLIRRQMTARKHPF